MEYDETNETQRKEISYQWFLREMDKPRSERLFEIRIIRASQETRFYEMKSRRHGNGSQATLKMMDAVNHIFCLKKLQPVEIRML